VLQLTLTDYDQIIGLLQQIKKEIAFFKRNDKHLLRALLYQVLILLHRRFTSLNQLSVSQHLNRYIHSFTKLVDTYHHQHRTVDYYAEKLHITGGHLNSIVKDNFGITAKRFILCRNILEAKRILQYTDMSIDEIADRLNYENTTYFIRTFKEHTGHTPLQFRKRINP
jgi:AraC-like DNA-binding protein